MKKIIIIILSVIIIVVAATIYYFYYYNKKEPTYYSTTINAVPLNASLIIECKNFHTLIKNLKNNNEMWKQLTKTSTVKNINNYLKYLDSLINSNTSLKSVLNNNPVFISIHPSGKDSFDNLFLLKLNSSFNETWVNSFFSEQLANKGTINERLYNNTKIYEVVLKNNDRFYTSVSKGIFIFSFSSFLVEDAIRQLQTDLTLSTDKGFKKILNTSGKNVDANIYINYKAFPKLTFCYFDENVKNLILSLKNFANWTELDVNIKDNALLLNGFTYSNDSENNYLNIFLTQEPQQIKIDKILPSTTSSFILLGIDNFKKYSDDYKKFLSHNNDYNSIDKELQKIKKLSDTDILNLFGSIFEHEACLSYTENNNNFVLINIKSKSQAEEELIKFLKKYSKKNKKDYSSLTSTYKIDNDTKFIIYQMPFKNITKLLFGKVFSNVESKYFSFYDNYMILGNTTKSISDFIQANILEKTLKNDVNYKKFSENLSSKSNFYFYSNFEGAKSYWLSFLNSELNKNFKDNHNIFNKFDALAYQLSSSKDMIYSNIFINYNPISTEKPQTVWESHLDSSISIKPFILNNSVDDEKEIFVQDLKNNIYLINKNGRILWKKLIPEKIISNIYQIDYYNNKKVQLVFSSQNYIYIIDRIGNYIDRYPLKLESPATNGISLFDIGNKKNYKIFIGCRNKKVYCYSKNGNIVKEWKFDKTDNYVYSEIQYFRTEKKEYIVFADSLKTYILDLKGNVKAKVSAYFPKSKNNKFIYEPKSSKTKERLITTDNSGIIYYIYFDGKAEHFPVNEFSPLHYFNFWDIDKNGNKEYVFLDKNILSVYEKDKSLIFSYNFTDNNNTRPEIYVFPDKSLKIGVVSKSENKIYLINNDGSVYKGFPLTGRTEFIMGKLDKTKKILNIIVGGNNNFLYNYEVN